MTFNENKMNELRSVLSTKTPCVSLYIPTYRTGHGQEDKIRFKNALSKVTDKLTQGQVPFQREFDKKEALKFLSPAYELLDKERFWQHLSDGLAVFLGLDRFEYYTVPVDFNPFAYVGREFYLRPLFPLIMGEDRFFLLALSQGEVRFFEGHQHHITPVIIEDLVPENLTKVLVDEKEPVLHAHSGGNGSSVFHGQGGGRDQKIGTLKKYFRSIDDGLMEMLHDENAPLLIAAVDYLVPIYREISRYPNIMDFHIGGNTEQDDPVLLHEKAWSLMSDFFQAEREEKKRQFREYHIKGKAATLIPDIVKAAQTGRIDTLFVNKHTSVVWGFHNQLTDHSVDLHEAQNEYNTCLLNYAAVQTWQNGGKVFNVPQEEFPQTEAEMNAVFRY